MIRNEQSKKVICPYCKKEQKRLWYNKSDILTCIYCREKFKVSEVIHSGRVVVTK